MRLILCITLLTFSITFTGCGGDQQPGNTDGKATDSSAKKDEATPPADPPKNENIPAVTTSQLVDNKSEYRDKKVIVEGFVVRHVGLTENSALYLDDRVDGDGLVQFYLKDGGRVWDRALPGQRVKLKGEYLMGLLLVVDSMEVTGETFAPRVTAVEWTKEYAEDHSAAYKKYARVKSKEGDVTTITQPGYIIVTGVVKDREEEEDDVNFVLEGYDGWVVELSFAKHWDKAHQVGDTLTVLNNDRLTDKDFKKITLYNSVPLSK